MATSTERQEVVVVPELNRVSLQDMAEQGARSSEMLNRVRNLMLTPDAEKRPPSFTTEAVANLCELTKSQFEYQLTKRADMPQGNQATRGTARRFSLKEARQWVRAHRDAPRTEDEDGLVIAVSNTKGGVGKTTTSFCLAQGLSLRGLNCCLLDADPQSSCTTLTGTVPDRDLKREDTLMPFLEGEAEDLKYAVRTTYWDGVDIIPSNTLASDAEFAIVAGLTQGQTRLWDRLVQGLRPLRKHYDVIVIDTAPAMSFLTINALFAADGLVVPIPPNALDYAAGAQFWRLFGDLATRLLSALERSQLRRDEFLELQEKRWEFTYVLPTHADPGGQSYGVVRDWMGKTYGERVFPVDIVRSKVAETLSAQFQTVYDVNRYEGNQASYQRLKGGYDRMAEIMDATISKVMQARRAEAK